MNWRYYFSPTTHPWKNLALENVWLEDAAENPIFFGYFNAPCTVIGKNQNLFQEVNLPYLFENQLPIVRRTSGGGTVYHDLGCLNLSFITKHQTKWVGKWDYFFDPLVSFLSSRGFEVHVNSRNSLLVDDKKVGGSAQKVSRGKMISHCSLLFHTNLTALQHSLSVKGNFESNASPSVRSQVMNLCETLLFAENSEEIFFQIKSIFEKKWGEFERIESLPMDDKLIQKEKELESLEWRFGRNPAFSFETSSGLRLTSHGESKINLLEFENEKWDLMISPFEQIPWNTIPKKFHPELKELWNQWKFHLDLEKTS